MSAIFLKGSSYKRLVWYDAVTQSYQILDMSFVTGNLFLLSTEYRLYLFVT